MIDFHTHILPGIDDGSRDVDMTLGILEQMHRQGVSSIIATPHFYANRRSVTHFLEKREYSNNRMRDAIKQKLQQDADWSWLSDLQVRCGAEVYYFGGMGGAERLSDLCIEGTRTILVEMPFEQWTNDFYHDVRDIIEKQKLTVVLAHVERYPEFQKRKDVWNKVMELPLIPQINTGSFIKKGGLFSRDKKYKFCMEFLKEHPDLILGSDCHNLTSRGPNFAEGRAAIVKALGEDAAARCDRTAENVLEIA